MARSSWPLALLEVQMDAAEADFDAKLYKASSDLIPELKVKLPQLIWHDGKSRARLRTHVLFYKNAELQSLVSKTIF
jgi:hypothetical protein